MEPSDEELLGLMPQQLRDDLATVARMAAHGAGPDVTPELFKGSLTAGALQFARSSLTLWGNHSADASKMVSPAPVPTEGEVAELIAWLGDEADQYDCIQQAPETARRLRRAAGLLAQCHPTPVPVAVSERLPQPENCDSEGRCWWFSPLSCYGSEGTWELMRTNGNTTGCTHWLPAHALPLPAGEVE